MKLTDVKVTFNPKSKFFEINIITECAVSQAHTGNSGDFENAEPMQLLLKKLFGHQEVQKTLEMQNRCNCYTGNSMQLLRSLVN